jgi:hypothetical protein
MGTSQAGLTICSCRKLSTSSKSICHKALEEDRIEIGTREVYGSRVTCGSRPYDHLVPIV